MLHQVSENVERLRCQRNARLLPRIASPPQALVGQIEPELAKPYRVQSTGTLVPSGSVPLHDPLRELPTMCSLKVQSLAAASRSTAYGQTPVSRSESPIENSALPPMRLCGAMSESSQ